MESNYSYDKIIYNFESSMAHIQHTKTATKLF